MKKTSPAVVIFLSILVALLAFILAVAINFAFLKALLYFFNAQDDGGGAFLALSPFILAAQFFIPFLTYQAVIYTAERSLQRNDLSKHASVFFTFFYFVLIMIFLLFRLQIT